MNSWTGLFVTGTDTDVGKTVVSAALMHRLRPHAPVQYWKPIQTGIEQSDDTATVASLGACSSEELLQIGIRLLRPVSPHLAARLGGTTIELDPLTRMAAGGSERLRIVEGAGGVLVPINHDQTMLDLMSALGLPVVVAARTALGTINHTLLTLQALRSRQLLVGGVVMVGEPNPDNRAAIEHYGHVRVLGEMPRFAPLDASSLKEWSLSELDPGGQLLHAAASAMTKS